MPRCKLEKTGYTRKRKKPTIHGLINNSPSIRLRRSLEFRSCRSSGFRSYRMDPRIPALSMVVRSYHWHSIKAVDLYFAPRAASHSATPELLSLLNSCVYPLFTEAVHLRLDSVYDRLKRFFRRLTITDHCFLSFLQLVPVQGTDRERRTRFGNRQQAQKEAVLRGKEILVLQQSIESRQRGCFLNEERLSLFSGGKTNKIVCALNVFGTLYNCERPSSGPRRFQPIWCGDVSRAMIKAGGNHFHCGKNPVPRYHKCHAQ